jgi:hypothetical protein
MRHAAFALAFLALSATPARADIPPSCDAQGSLITCAATDVGKPCQGGGKCHEVQCVSGGDAVAKVYKCDACPTIIAAPSGTCTISNMGSACSDGAGATGTCGAIRSYCNTSADKFVCQKPSTETPTGPPGGMSVGNSGGGCDVAPDPSQGMIGLGLAIAGFVFVVVERVRRRNRWR